MHPLSQLYYCTAKIVGLQERGLRSMPGTVEKYPKREPWITMQFYYANNSSIDSDSL